MKNIITIVAFIVGISSACMPVGKAFGQTKIDQDRMSRDLEIAENALSTIIKQQFDKRSMWLDVKANYTPGYGVTMRLPNENNAWQFESNGYGYNLRSGGPAVMAPPPLQMVVEQ